MSETTGPTNDITGPLPAGTPSRKPISPWLLGCGVLAMALFALGLLALVVAGVLLMAVRTKVRPLPARTGTAVAQQKLSDGSLLVLEQVTYGREHHFDSGFVEPTRSRLSGPPSPSNMPVTQTQKDTIVVWFTQWDSTAAKPMDFAWLQRCAAVDAQGDEIDNIDKGRYASGGSGSSSEHGGDGPFSRLSGGPYDRIVTCFGLPAFRHEGPTFKLRLYDKQNRKVAEFDVPNPRASKGTYPQWQPESLPVTKNDGDLSLTLTALTARSSESTSTVNGVASKVTRVQVNAIVTAKQEGQLTDEWNVRSHRLFDALGNESSIWDCELSPYESAWELEIKAWRHDKARFEPDEIWTLPQLAVPQAQRTEYVNKTRTLDQVGVTLVAVGGTGKVSYPGIPAAYRGGYSTSGSSYFGQGNQRRHKPPTRSKLITAGRRWTVKYHICWSRSAASRMTSELHSVSRTTRAKRFSWVVRGLLLRHSISGSWMCPKARNR